MSALYPENQESETATTCFGRANPRWCTRHRITVQREVPNPIVGQRKVMHTSAKRVEAPEKLDADFVRLAYAASHEHNEGAAQ